MKNELKIFGAPARYIQGPNAIDQIGELVARLGQRAVLIADCVVLGLVGGRIESACAAANVRCTSIEFNGDIVPTEVERLAALARAHEPVVVIACGGGKSIDAGKALAHQLGCRVVTVPTVASNDAPTSKNYVLYDEQHRLLRVEHLPANPDAVIVDTEVIVRAPLHLFTAGIGDAIVKKFEVAQCVAAGGRNMYGAGACRAAVALSELCHDTLRADAVEALAAVRAQRVSDAFERVVESTVLHSGLGFESGGLSISHAMTRGLSAVRGARDALHGHQVAYALWVQLVLEERPAAFLDDMAQFYVQTALPRTLGELGMPNVTPQEMHTIAAGTMTAPHVRNFWRAVSAEDLVRAMEEVERR
jgi:glycerol dehydrogenase